jgi:hypothetical protein
MTAAQVLDECEEEMDEEIAMLLAANEKGLKQVRLECIFHTRPPFSPPPPPFFLIESR